MRIDLIPSGTDVPHSVNVLIEVPIGGEPVKYEFDKPSGAIFVDRLSERWQLALLALAAGYVTVFLATVVVRAVRLTR